MSATLNLPLDFERRGSVRLLILKLRLDVSHGLAAAIQIWIDWAVARCEFRPLRRFFENDNAPINWKEEDLAFIIASAVGYDITDQVPGLMEACIESGFIRLEVRDGKRGLVLDGFWPLNEHLSPDFVSMQKRGGHAAQAKRLAKEAEILARQQRELNDRQHILPFGSERTTAEEEQACYALFIRLYRICELDVPGPNEYTEDAMADALRVIRLFTTDQILEVETWLLSNRDNPQLVKSPEKILKAFEKFVSLTRDIS